MHWKPFIEIKNDGWTALVFEIRVKSGRSFTKDLLTSTMLITTSQCTTPLIVNADIFTSENTH